METLYPHFTNRADWEPTEHLVLCELYFEEKFLIKGERTTLNWNLYSVPTKHSEEFRTLPSVLPTTSTSPKAPTKRNFQEDQWKQSK